MSGIAKLSAKVGSFLSTFAKSKPAKILGTTGAIGGGSYLALSGVGSGIEKINDATGLSSVIKIINPDAGEKESKGSGTIIGLALILGVVALALFVFVPQFNKVRVRK